ncbi:MAG: hypothetical protein HUU29_03850 [Planctomycetaceae bacterium]|nr:hypothetical protein [Planctomycetaceae bacterium]
MSAKKNEAAPPPERDATAEEVADPAYWEKVYNEESPPGWDIGEPSPPLIRFFEDDPKPPVKPGRAIVPGCGYGHDALYGGSGADWLYGEADNDYLDGGNDSTKDYLYGGSGADQFVDYYIVIELDYYGGVRYRYVYQEHLSDFYNLDGDWKRNIRLY